MALLGLAMLVSVQVAQSDADGIPALAAQAGVDETELRGALNSQPGVDAADYLRSEGFLQLQEKATAGIWDALAACESEQRWSLVDLPYYGGLQFDLPSWRAAGGAGLPSQASRAEQIRIAVIWQRERGWSAWPACSRQLGLR